MKGFSLPGAWIDEIHALDTTHVEWTPLSTLTIEGYEAIFPISFYTTLETAFPGRVRAHRALTDADYARVGGMPRTP